MTDIAFRPSIKLQLDNPLREKGRVLVHSGVTTRNRDWWTGKPLRLVPDGMRLNYFLKNPLVLWMHDFNLPLAKSDLFLEDGQLWATDDLQFHRRTIPVVATSGGFFGGGAAVGEFDTAVIADLWEGGFYNAVSVHVIFRPEDEENIEELEEEVVAGTSEVLEWSIVTMPGDPESGREVEQEVVERMVHSGMRRDVAKCLSTPGAFQVIGSNLVVPAHMLKTAHSGSSVSAHPVPEVPKMKPEEVTEQVEEVAAVEAAPEVDETAAFETLEVVEEEVVQEIEIPAVELAQLIAEDAEALHVLAMALVQQEGFAEALMSSLAQQPQAQATELVAMQPAPITVKFVSNGRKTETRPAVQMGGMVKAGQPVLVGSQRPTVAQAAPAAMPNATQTPKKGVFGTMYRKS